MAFSNAATRAVTCHGCRQHVLRSFISSIGGPWVLPQQQQQRAFCRTPQRLDEARKSIAMEEHVLNDTNESKAQKERSEPPVAANGPMAEAEAQVRSVPWYLQHQLETQPEVQSKFNPLATRQKLPELLSHSPGILQPLLERVSVDLGMDSLSLLDLRRLDPPPALGANLLMIIGTARSEKHLHVSADRLCRWLRSEYKLSPYADGLLGRNELKLKMKRKAKRARLMSVVGSKATADTAIEDGIRTGWVCVNVGRVEGGDLPEEVGKLQRQEGFVGFGARTAGARIVVQLMTEEKRGEVDLEKLWSGIMNRAHRQAEKEAEEGADEPTEDAGDISATIDPSRQAFHGQANYHPASHMSGPSAGQQLRAYHTSARRPQASGAPNLVHAADSQTEVHRPSLPVNTSERSDRSLAALNTMIARLRILSKTQALRLLGAGPLCAPSELGVPTPSQSVDEDLVVEALKFKRPVLSNEVARSKVVAIPPNATAFLQSFYAAMPPFPTASHWHAHIQLLIHARAAGHQGAHSHVLLAQLQNMQLAGLVPQEQTYEAIVWSIFTPLGSSSGPLAGSSQGPTTHKLRLVLDLMEEMETHGYQPLPTSIMEALYLATIGPPLPPFFSPKDLLPAFGAARLRRQIAANDWGGFLTTFSLYPRRFLPRTAEMYAVLFEAIAMGVMDDVRQAKEMLRTYVPEMEREVPAVRIEDDAKLARLLKEAVEIVEPEVRNGGGGEWRAAWERCHGVGDLRGEVR